MTGTAIPTTYKAQIGTRHQFEWDATVPEVGAFCLANPYPTPPALTGPGVVVRGPTFQNVADLVTAASAITFDLYRQSDNTTGSLAFGAGPHSISSIITAINAANPAWGVTPFAYGALDIGGESFILNLVDKKPLLGDAGIEVRLSLTNNTNRDDASRFLNMQWGQRSTAAPVTVYQSMSPEFTGFLLNGNISDAYTLPAGADTIGVMFRVSSQLKESPVVILLWSDGQAPFDGSVGSVVANTGLGIAPIKTLTDFGVSELELNPTRGAPIGEYPLQTASTFKLDGSFPLSYNVDSGFPTQSIVDLWVNSTLTVTPPAGMTQLRIGYIATSSDPVEYPSGAPGLGCRIQAYAWASRKGNI